MKSLCTAAVAIVLVLAGGHSPVSGQEPPDKTGKEQKDEKAALRERQLKYVRTLAPEVVDGPSLVYKLLDKFPEAEVIERDVKNLWKVYRLEGGLIDQQVSTWANLICIRSTRTICLNRAEAFERLDKFVKDMGKPDLADLQETDNDTSIVKWHLWEVKKDELSVIARIETRQTRAGRVYSFLTAVTDLKILDSATKKAKANK